MPLPADLRYLDPLLDVLVEMAIADVRAGISKDENGAEFGQEQRRREKGSNDAKGTRKPRGREASAQAR